jgi:hypothetical protein
VEDWDIPDPARMSIEDVRAIRDALDARVKDLVENRLDEIRADRTSHELRLQRLLPDLVHEFRGVRSDGEIRACADAILSDYDEVPVRSFVMTLAHRRTRDCLGADRCDALVSAWRGDVPHGRSRQLGRLRDTIVVSLVAGVGAHTVIYVAIGVAGLDTSLAGITLGLLFIAD